jgi:Cft2 family RNA processing exonuclease
VEITTIGGADRIGASCALVKTCGMQILIDCGNDTADGLSREDLVRSPEIDLGRKLRDIHIDLAIITHGHNDHVGALVQVMKDHPHMRVMMTRPTLETARMILADGISIRYKDTYGNIAERDKDARREELNEMRELLTLPKVEIIRDIRENPAFISPFPGVPIQIGAFPADHIRGAITVLLKPTENGKPKSVLFTGDFGMEDKETVLAAPIRDEYKGVDLVLLDSTNGNTILEPREVRLAKLTAIVDQTLKRGGNVLAPAFGVERSGEVMIHLIKQGFKVFMDGMGNRYLKLCRSPEGRWCDRDRMFHALDPVWKNFVEVEQYRNPRFSQGITREKIVNSRKPWVVVATSATLKGGPSAEYAMRIIEDPKSAIVFTSHIFKNTPAYTLYNEKGAPLTLTTRLFPEGKPVIPQCEVEQVRLSAHMHQPDIVRFVETIRPKQIAPVHCGGPDSHDALEEILGKKFSVVRTRNGMTIEL